MNKDNYQRLFSNKTIRERAIEQALDTRKFEIDLYWKRATYFWAFIAATFAGYFLILSRSGEGLENKNVILFFINCLGFAFSISWYLVNRGSKFWQENWEKHVDHLENKYMGPLFKVIIEDKSKGITAAGRFSVSRINIILSLFITVMWGVLGINTILIAFIGNIPVEQVIAYLNYERLAILVLLILVLFFVGFLFKKGESNISPFDKNIHYDLRSASIYSILNDIQEAITEEEEDSLKEASHGQAKTGSH